MGFLKLLAGNPFRQCFLLGTIRAGQKILQEFGFIFMKQEPSQVTEVCAVEAEGRSWLAQYYTGEKTGLRQRLPVPTVPMRVGSLTVRAAGKYTLQESVGSGGMKHVARARDNDALRDVAVATPRNAGDVAGADRFVREARIAAMLEHPNIVPVHDMGVDESGAPFFTMKLLEGETLLEMLYKLRQDSKTRGKRRDLGPLIEIFLKVCDAISFAHSKGVLHLDLKPSNIQVGGYGEVLVIDWGLARVVSDPEDDRDCLPEGTTEPADQTLDGVIKGTPGYMAPEQALGRNRSKDARTDVYALGAILYSILTLESPICSADRDRMLADTIEGRITPPRKRRPDLFIPAALDAVCMKAMARDPECRYPSVADLVRDVRAFSGGFAPSAQSVGLPTLLWLLIKRNRRISLIVMVCLAIVAAIGVVSVVRIKRSEALAVESLRKFQDEQEMKTRLGKLALSQLMQQGTSQIRGLDFEQADQTLDLVLSLDPKRPEACNLKGMLHMARLEFEQAAAMFREGLAVKPEPAEAAAAARKKPKDTRKPAPTPPTAADMADRYAHRYAQTPSRPDPSLLLELTEDLANSRFARHPFGSCFVGLMYERMAAGAGDGSDESLALVKEALRRLNPKVRQLDLLHSTVSGGLAVRLSGGRDLKDLAPLMGLPIVSLDLSDTGVSDLQFLKRMPLEELNLANTQVSDFSPLIESPVRRLNLCGYKRLSLPQLAKLPKLETLTVSKDVIPARKPDSHSRPLSFDIIEL